MCDDNKSKQQQQDPGLTSGDLPGQSGKEAKARLRSKPTRKPTDKKIHPRQKIPVVPKGKETPDDTPSPPVDLD